EEEPVGDADALGVAGGGVAAVVVEEVAVVGHLVRRLAVGLTQLRLVHARPRSHGAALGQRRPRRRTRAGARARGALVLSEEVERVAVGPGLVDALRPLGEADRIARRRGRTDAAQRRS